MAVNHEHYDAWGNPILGYLEMCNYYPEYEYAGLVVRRSMPFRYAVIPSVEIRIRPGETGIVEVIRTYPGGYERDTRKVTARALVGLRKCYLGKGGWQHRILIDGSIALSKKGTIVQLNYSKFGTQNPEYYSLWDK